MNYPTPNTHTYTHMVGPGPLLYSNPSWHSSESARLVLSTGTHYSS